MFGPSCGPSMPRRLYVKNSDFVPRQSQPFIEHLLKRVNGDIDNMSTPKLRHTNLSTLQKNMLSYLVHQTDITVLDCDKNLGPAVLTTDQYISLCLQQLHDDTTYTQCNAPVATVKKLLLSRLRKYSSTLPSNDPSTRIVTHNIDNLGLNTFYGLLKIHKPTLCIRPIVANTNGILSGLSKWLDYQLQPIFKSLPSYLRDSDHLLSVLPGQVPAGTMITSVDVVSMYTNIPTDHALAVIDKKLSSIEHPLRQQIVRGLEVVMKNNYFTFNGDIYHQLQGTAMGTAVAPSFASIYLGIIEEVLLDRFGPNLLLYRRFIDDIIMLTHPDSKPFLVKQMLAMLTRDSKLQFTFNSSYEHMTFLDLDIHIDEHSSIYTKTHVKDTSLFLYLPSSSAHPPGMLRGLIMGRVLKYHSQNTHVADFEHFVKQLYFNLLRRGYHSRKLKPLFKEALLRCHPSNSSTPSASSHTSTSSKGLFLKVRYDPNGLSRTELRELFQVKHIEEYFNTRVTICFTKPPSLRSILRRSQASTSTNTV